MAGVIQLGDAIKFAELAKTVWELGWSREHNASKNYRDFGADVSSLHSSLKELERVVRRAQESFRNHGALDNDKLGGDRNTLFEIIGDYNATLRECRQLLNDNQFYEETTGPIRNISWNINVMPQVEHLRGRIQMHTSRVQHILKPFQMMKELDELQNPRRLSHWPGYLRSLEGELSDKYSLVQSLIIVPGTSLLTNEVLAFWPEDEPQAMEPVAPAAGITCLFQASLCTRTPDISRREIQLLRYPESGHDFRIVETFESNSLPPRKSPKVVDFDLDSAVLIPSYADPMDSNGETRPFEIIIEEDKLQHSYVFLCLQDVLAFQAAVTGFKVVDGYMESRAMARCMFKEKKEGPLENATIQLWIPRGWFNTDDSALKAPAGEQQSRSDSISSHQSMATNSPSTSHNSLGSEHNVPVKLGGSTVGTGHGTIRRPPGTPLLVLFTRSDDPKSRRSIVAITIDQYTERQRDKCMCLRLPHCPITAVGNSHAGIDAHRFDGDKWDLLRLVTSRGNEEYRLNGVIRVSIWFPELDLRKKFGGENCLCPTETEGELDLCHMQGHQGLLGVVRDVYRRLLIQYQEHTNNKVHVVNSPPYG
ncbi:aspartate aminotransferase protein [Fusarium flagelliforme]|uniref:Aspartate aminotransferase protein n=1 Tax=Fusarium flagelliforme TaxID=2675880 RepID=A0A395MTK4_9HYPO|nr:aspartate aminotransferase protein [Fusarium flagelliforme]